MSDLGSQAHYDALGVAQGATAQEIKNAYRLLAMKWHPSHGSGEEALDHFKHVTIAYRVLSRMQDRPKNDHPFSALEQESLGELEISDEDAARIFFDAMLELGNELVRLGYNAIFVFRALSEEGCPPDIAQAVADTVAPNAITARQATRRRAGDAPGLPNPLGGMKRREASRTLVGTRREDWPYMRTVALGAAVLAIPVLIAVYKIGDWASPSSNALESGGGGFANMPAPSASRAAGARESDPAVSPPTAAQVDFIKRRAVNYELGSLSPGDAVQAAARDWDEGDRGIPRSRSSRVTSQPAPQASGGRSEVSDSEGNCATDRDCPAGYACARSSTHAAWNCRIR